MKLSNVLSLLPPQQNPCQHPIIILRDVAYVDMSALLSFVYQGEVYVSQDRLTTFLRTAELLHIKGLTEQNQQQPHLATHQLHRDQVRGKPVPGYMKKDRGVYCQMLSSCTSTIFEG